MKKRRFEALNLEKYSLPEDLYALLELLYALKFEKYALLEDLYALTELLYALNVGKHSLLDVQGVSADVQGV